MTFREQAQLLGPQRSLVGIFTEPLQPAGGDGPLVVLLNSGIVHRVGANRMSVRLARALADAGHAVLRFDLSGIGDSPPRADALDPLASSLADIRDVLDTVERTRGTRRVILGGLCSGADQSVVYAAGDPRVVGAILLDPTAPITRRARLHHYRKRLLRGESWLNVLRGKNPLWRSLKARASRNGHGGKAPPPGPSYADLRSPEVRAFLERAYGGAVRGGVRLLAIATGDRSTYRRQLVHGLPAVSFGDQLRLEYLGHSDHTFALEADRARVIELVVEWVAHTPFAERTATAAAAGAAAGAGVRG